jgi:hypothetical protein
MRGCLFESTHPGSRTRATYFPHLFPPSDTIVVLASTPPFHSSTLFPREPVAIERDDAAVYPSQHYHAVLRRSQVSVDIPQPIDISPLNAENINEQLHLESGSTLYQSQNTGTSICIYALPRSDEDDRWITVEGEPPC